MKQHILLYKGDGIGPELFESLRAFFYLFEDLVECSYIQTLSTIPADAAPLYILCGPLEEDIALYPIVPQQEAQYTLSIIPSIHTDKGRNTIRILSSPVIGTATIHQQMETLIQSFQTTEKIVLVHEAKEYPDRWKETMKAWARLAFSDSSLQLEDSNLYTFIKHGKYKRASQIITSAEISTILTAIDASTTNALYYSYRQIRTGKNILSMPLHGHAPDITGMGIANPLALILAFCGLLKEMGHIERAQKVENQIEILFRTYPEQCTPDMGGILNTEKYIAMIAECINL